MSELRMEAPLLSEYFRRQPGGSATVVAKPKPSFYGFISNGPDDGALAMLRKLQLPVWSHSTLQEFGSNITNAFRQQPTQKGFNQTATIIGHGNFGFVDVGDGSWNDSDGGSIQLRNERLWAPYFEQLRAPTVLYPRPTPRLPPIPIYRGVSLLSCSTAGGGGRQLMQRIADIGNLVVSAWTGLVFVTDRYWFAEPGANLARCIPSDASDVARAHYRPEYNWEEPATPRPTPLIGHQKGLDTRQDAILSGIDSISASTSRGSSTVTISGSDAESVASKVFMAGPYRMDGEFIGSYAVKLVITYANRAPITVGVIANRMAVTGDGYAFFVGRGLKAELERLGVKY